MDIKQLIESGKSGVMTREQQIFEQYPVPRAVLAMALPTIISQVIFVIYNLADTWYVGLTNDPHAIAAISLCLPVYNIMSAISNLFGVGGASVLARSLGQKRMEDAKKAFSAAFWGALFTAAMYSLLLFLFGRPLLLRIGGGPEDIDYALTYTLYTMVLGGIPTILATAFAHLVRATGASAQAGRGLSLGAVLNIFLDPLFMFVLLPQGSELMGAALATAVSNTVTLLYFVTYVLTHRKESVYTVRPSLLKNARKLILDLLGCGTPSFTMVALAMLSNCFLNAMIASLGSAAMAGLGIVRKIDMLAHAVNQGTTQGMLPLVAYCYASGRQNRLKKVVGFSTVCTESFSLVWTTVSVVFAPFLVSLFIQDGETIQYGARFLRILSKAIPVYSITFVIIAVFQAVGRRAEPFLLSVLHKGSVDILMLFVIRWKWGVPYVPWATLVSETLALAIAFFMLFHFFSAGAAERTGS